MQDLIPRNNTSFIKSAYEVLKNIAKDSKDILKYHQRLVHEYLLFYPHIRGILAFWGMGSGKTILAVSIVDSLVNNPNFRKTLFISSKTLHGNFVGDYKKYLKLEGKDMSELEMENYIKSHCQFITLTANNMLHQVHNAVNESDDIFSDLVDDSVGSLDDTFVIIDEAHNFFNGITNGSKNYVGLYELIMKAKNIKLLFLTGSPITNDPFEIALCFNMINGYYYTGSKSKKHGKQDEEKLTLFGEDYQDFKKYFVSNPSALDIETAAKIDGKVLNPTINNKDKFANRIVGLVSYYGTDQAEIKALFPKVNELIVQKVPMSTKQYTAYAAARDKEQEETKKNFMTVQRTRLQKPSGASSSYRVRSRQLSNYLFPEYATKSYKDERGFDKYEKYIDELKPDFFTIAELSIYSPKVVQLLTNISIHLPADMLPEFKELAKTKQWMPTLLRNKLVPGIGPGVVYSQFIDSGIGLLGRILKHHGMKEIASVADIKDHMADIKNGKKNGGTFVIISGEVTPELRDELIKLSISPDNKDGKLLTLLLITATGAEGISTKYMRHVSSFEPFWHWSRIQQVIARAARLGSHVDLSQVEQTVQPYIYLSDYPAVFEDAEQVKIKTLEDTTDVNLYYKAIQNQILINSFLNCLQETSIDCNMHYSGHAHIKCKICAPTNEPLFIDDLSKDMTTISPCQEFKEEKIKAQSVILEDNNGKREYMYTFDNKGDITIFHFEPNINAYSEILQDHPDYYDLYEKIMKSQSKKAK